MTQLILVAFSIFAIDSFTYAVGPANILECFGAAKDAAEIGAPPGTKNYLNFKCFDGNGPYTNACNLTIMGITSKADRYNYCLRGPPYVNLLSCCATCASKMKDDTSELGVRSLATLTAILAANQTCTNGIESIENQLAGANTCARMAQANPGMCAPTRYNMCRFAFFNCRAYCYSVNKAFGWCSYNGGAAMGTDN